MNIEGRLEVCVARTCASRTAGRPPAGRTVGPRMGAARGLARGLAGVLAGGWCGVPAARGGLRAAEAEGSVAGRGVGPGLAAWPGEQGLASPRPGHPNAVLIQGLVAPARAARPGLRPWSPCGPLALPGYGAAQPPQSAWGHRTHRGQGRGAAFCPIRALCSRLIVNEAPQGGPAGSPGPRRGPLAWPGLT